MLWKYALEACLIFLAAALLDGVWAKYIQAAASGKKLAAANWSFLIYVFGSTITLAYVAHPWAIVPAALGSWFGTYFGTKNNAPVVE